MRLEAVAATDVACIASPVNPQVDISDSLRCKTCEQPRRAGDDK
jgi:hypothetical protein